MESGARPIEIFTPFGEAYELMKNILFRPFDLKKWFVIGFAAWLATFFNGGGFNYKSTENRSWHWQSYRHGANWSFAAVPPWVFPVAIMGFLVVIAVIALLLWLNSRGRFMFIDCIVRNRGAIAEPWREYQTDGNRFFIFQIVIALCSLIAFGGLAFLLFLGWAGGSKFMPVALVILFGVIFCLLAIVISLVVRFMAPVMYRQRCEAMDAFRQVWSLITDQPGVFILFALFYFVLVIASFAVGCLVACLTCCVAAIPYLGTVILLPLVLWLFAFPLCFLRQFGDAYDVWAVVRSTEPPPPPVPPVQGSLPPA